MFSHLFTNNEITRIRLISRWWRLCDNLKTALFCSDETMCGENFQYFYDLYFTDKRLGGCDRTLHVITVFKVAAANRVNTTASVIIIPRECRVTVSLTVSSSTTVPDEVAGLLFPRRYSRRWVLGTYPPESRMT